MNELGPNLIRTYVPIGVGFVASWLTARGIGVSPATQAELIAAMTSIFTAAYYTVVRLVEEWWPQAGVLLGCRKPAAAVADAEVWPPQADESQEWPPQEDRNVQVVGGQRQDSLAELVATTPPSSPERRRGPITGQMPKLRRPDGR